DAKGQIYSGGVKGSEFFKNVAGVLAAMPGASQDMKDRVASTQAWDARGGALAFDALYSLPGTTTIRGSPAILDMIKSMGPNTVMEPAARQMVYNYMRTVFQTQLSLAKAAATETARPGVTNLSNLQAPSTPKITTNPDGSYSLDLTR